MNNDNLTKKLWTAYFKRMHLKMAAEKYKNYAESKKVKHDHANRA